jgi:hypothetical protein
MLLNSATANDGSQMSNDKRASKATHALDWRAYASRVLVVAPRDDELFFCLAIRQEFALSRQQHRHPARLHSLQDRAPLGRDPVGQRIGMKSSVITQTKPGTIGLGSLRYRVFLTRGKIVP